MVAFKYPRKNSGTLPVPTRAQSEHRVPVYTPSLVLGQSTALYPLLGSCFKMTSGVAIWSNYVHSRISGTQGVNTTPFCAGTLRYSFPSTKCGQPHICTRRLCIAITTAIWKVKNWKLVNDRLFFRDTINSGGQFVCFFKSLLSWKYCSERA